ncbi:MAG: response regulator [Vicinamibacteria bacterium]
MGASEAGKISVLLADDHTILREGLRSLLAAASDVNVVGEAETGREAVQLARRLKPAVVVMDIAMPMLNGLEATRQIRSADPSTKVLVLSMHSDSEYVEKVLEAGATGYLVKQTGASDLLTAIREIHRGNVFLSPSISRLLVDQYRTALRTERPGNGHKLTPREIEVLQLVAEGMTNKEIASELAISVKTVEKHRQQVMDKLGIHDVAGLTRYAMTSGII